MTTEMFLSFSWLNSRWNSAQSAFRGAIKPPFDSEMICHPVIFLYKTEWNVMMSKEAFPNIKN